MVSFEVPQLVRHDIFVYYDGKTVFLPLLEIFRTLELAVEPDFANRRFSGFVIDKSNRFSLDLGIGRARAMGKEWPLGANECYFSDRELYLRVDLFQRFFGLNMQFSFAALRVSLPLNRDFPSYQRLKRYQQRQRLQTRGAALKDVRVLPRRREYLDGAVLDWAISANAMRGQRHYFDFQAGAMILGGDFSISGSGDNREGLDADALTYRWHYYFENKPYISFAELGFINTTGPLSQGLKGVLVTNRPQTERRHFQTMNYSGHLGPGWEVELYVDQKLIAFQKTDSQGEYNFDVDIFYGPSLVTLKMYGPNGEMRTEEKYINIPYDLIPRGKLEYAVAGGQTLVRTGAGRYAQTEIAYGASEHLSVRGGLQVPMVARTKEKTVPIGGITWRVSNNAIADAFYASGYASGVALNFSRPSAVNVNTAFTTYRPEHPRNLLKRLHSLQFTIFWPVKIVRFVGLRGHASWDKFASGDFVNASAGVNLPLSKIQLNYLARGKLSIRGGRTFGNATSEAVVSVPALRIVQVQLKGTYDHESRRLADFNFTLAKRLFKSGQLGISYDRNMIARTDLYMCTFSLMTDFASLTTKALSAGQGVQVSQIQRGSISYDSQRNVLRFDRRNNVGFGSAVLRPFLDQNLNGQRDQSEQYIGGVKARFGHGRERMAPKSKLCYYDGLKPYVEHLLQIDPTSIDNPTLKPLHQAYRVSCNPNVVTPIEIPLVETCELTGMVARRQADNIVGIGGVRLLLFNVATEVLTEITAFSNGEFFCDGVIPGKYRLYPDSKQIGQLGYISSPEAIELEIGPADAGKTIAVGNFLLVPSEKE